MPLNSSCPFRRGPCPAGTQSGDRIAYTTGSGGDAGDIQTTYLDEGRCYAPSTDPNDAPGQDVTGTYSASYWRVGSNPPPVGVPPDAELRAAPHHGDRVGPMG